MSLSCELGKFPLNEGRPSSSTETPERQPTTGRATWALREVTGTGHLSATIAGGYVLGWHMDISSCPRYGDGKTQGFPCQSRVHLAHALPLPCFHPLKAGKLE